MWFKNRRRRGKIEQEKFKCTACFDFFKTKSERCQHYMEKHLTKERLDEINEEYGPHLAENVVEKLYLDLLGND